MELAPETAMKYRSHEHYNQLLLSKSGLLETTLDGYLRQENSIAGSLAGTIAQNRFP